MAFIPPTFADIDFGFSGGDLYPDDVRSQVKVTVGPRLVATVGYNFPGVDGELQHTLGKRKRSVRWNMVINAKDLGTLNALERNIEDAQTAGAGTLRTTTGRIFERAVLSSYQPGEGFGRIQGGEMDGWIRRTAIIEFFVLSAD